MPSWAKTSQEQPYANHRGVNLADPTAQVKKNCCHKTVLLTLFHSNFSLFSTKPYSYFILF